MNKDTDTTNQEKKLSPAGQEIPKIDKIRNFLMEHYDFRFNDIMQTLEYKEKADPFFVPFTDKLKRDIVIRLKQQRFSKPNDDLDDILNSSLIPNFNPIQEYFDCLEFSGYGHVKRLGRCIKLNRPDMIIGGKPYQQLFDDFFERWLMACYLCVTGKSINDAMLILIGQQGQFKTTFLNYLTPNALIDYRVCTNINPSLTDYNTANFLTEKFFINVDDQMEKIFGKDYNSMKSIISAPDVTSRKLYRSNHQRRRRIANFCGSVNESRFLRDSNNRRYLCFAVADISSDYQEIDINAVWAEIKRKVEAQNKIYIFGKEDYVMIDLMNNQYEAPTEEAETLQSLFMPVVGEPDPNKYVYWMSFTEILKLIRGHAGNNQLKSYNLQTAMRKYGYTPQAVRKERFGMQPRNLYAVQPLTNDPALLTYLIEYK